MIRSKFGNTSQGVQDALHEHQRTADCQAAAWFMVTAIDELGNIHLKLLPRRAP